MLAPKDWESFINSGWVADAIKEGKCRLDGENCPIWDKSGKGQFKGVQVTVDDVEIYKED